MTAPPQCISRHRTRRRYRHNFPVYQPTITLEPRTTAPTETWSFTLPGGRSGVTIDDVTWAASYMLLLAKQNGWRGGVSLRLPKAGRYGLRDQTIIVAHPSELHRLRAVDVEGMMRRRGLAFRGSARAEEWTLWNSVWAGVQAVVGRLRMPVAWPAVP